MHARCTISWLILRRLLPASCHLPPVAKASAPAPPSPMYISVASHSYPNSLHTAPPASPSAALRPGLAGTSRHTRRAQRPGHATGPRDLTPLERCRL
ncbi:hypothetical protein FB451DRAFT_1272842 [Mycena latifolia]|nr:hypothetical protein FB451DRAFT_1272842 [Mycena latifolia]